MDLSLTLSRQEFIKESLAVKNNKAGHAYLIEGDKGVGKLSFALAVACTYFCTGEDKPCLNCNQCKKVLAGNHPDVHFFKPEKNLIKVDAVRELISTVYETPYEGKVKIYIISDFHLANEQAQNALLKTLEEPPRNVVFLLLCENSLSLLPTVRSRCLKISLKEFSTNKIEEFLKNNFSENPNCGYAISASRGNIGKAIRLLEDEEYLEIDREVQAVVTKISAGASSEEIFNMLQCENEFLTLLQDKLYYSFKIKPDVAAIARLKAVQDAIDAKGTNVNKTLILEKLAYELVKGGTKWQR